MHIINRIAAFHHDTTAWRRDIHAHPETAFEERRTAALIADNVGDHVVARPGVDRGAATDTAARTRG